MDVDPELMLEVAATFPRNPARARHHKTRRFLEALYFTSTLTVWLNPKRQHQEHCVVLNKALVNSLQMLSIHLISLESTCNVCSYFCFYAIGPASDMTQPPTAKYFRRIPRKMRQPQLTQFPQIQSLSLQCLWKLLSCSIGLQSGNLIRHSDHERNANGEMY